MCMKVVTAAFFGLCAIAAVYGIASPWIGEFSWPLVWLALASYTIRGLGVTIGYHRLATHRSFGASPIVRCLWYVAGASSFQGSIATWVCDHRAHHRASDSLGDPHTPWRQNDDGAPYWTLQTALIAHIGWLFLPRPSDNPQAVKKIAEGDPVLAWVDRTNVVWCLLPFFLAGTWGYASGGLVDCFRLMAWGNLIPLFWGYNATWSVNSVCHLWEFDPIKWCGLRPTEKRQDRSVNNLLVAFLTWGEGYHGPAGHHGRQNSANHGRHPLDPDIGAWVIRLMEWCRLAHKVRWHYDPFLPRRT